MGRKKAAVIKTGFLYFFLGCCYFILYTVHNWYPSLMSKQICSQCQATYEPNDRFCEFCGQPFYTPIQSATPPPRQRSGGRFIILQNGKRFKLVGDREFWVGRADPANDWHPKIDLGGHGGLQGGVSRKHGRITLEGQQLYLEDNGSSNGTVLNGIRLTIGQRLPIHSGDELLFGRIYARVKIDE